MERTADGVIRITIIPLFCWLLSLIFIYVYQFPVPMVGMVNETDFTSPHFWWTATLSYLFYGFICFTIPLMMLIQYVISKSKWITNHSGQDKLLCCSAILLCFAWATLLSQLHLQ
ncbi:hypothetical protein [Pseudoalteromonas piscicida]